MRDNELWLQNNNTYRDMLAEFLVAKALNLESITRAYWELYDLLYDGIKIEVKSSAYIKAQEQEELYAPRFDIHEAATTGDRVSDVYVFCLLSEKDCEAINPLDLNLWDFFVAKTSVINSTFDKQKSAALSVIEPICIHAQFSKIKQAIKLTAGVA